MKYRKKSVGTEDLVIEGLQWKGHNERNMFNFLTSSIDKEITLEEDTFRIDLVNGGCQVGNLIIKTPEGEVKADISDYIIKNADGNFHPCKKDIFDKNYEAIVTE